MLPATAPLRFLFHLLGVSLGLLGATIARAAEPAMTAPEIPSPAGSPALGARVTMSPDGVAWLTWLETQEDKTIAFRFATFDRVARRWSAPGTIAQGPALHAGASDFPALTVSAKGQATALWYVKNPPSPETAHLHHGAGYHAVLSSTSDAGKTWTAPVRLSSESDINEFAALTTLADGRVLAVWLDARVKKIMGAHPDHKAGAHGAMKLSQQLYSRIVAPASAVNPEAADTLVEFSVCDCCHTALTAFPDGTALLVYRGRSEEEARDMRVTRFRGNQWDEPRTLNVDDWRILGCPVNGPQLASDGGRVGVAWFTAAENDPRVLASFSPDAGARFLMPVRLSDTKAAGRVSTLLLHDGAMLVSWMDAAGSLLLRRITPDYAPAATATLTRPEETRIKGFPRLALLTDYKGGKTSAEALLTFTTENPQQLRTLLITIPEGAFLEAAAKECDCAPTPEQLQGFPIRATLAAVAADRKRVSVRHAEIPGMFAAGTREFAIAPAALPEALRVGGEFLGRFDRDDHAGWRLLDLRPIAPSQAPRP
jgi:hypothetical protein